jgi:predicted phosphodiesterase
MGGGDGGQTFFGVMVIWNSGRHRCRIIGDTHFTATLTGGRKDPNARVNTSSKAPVGVTLPDRTLPPVDADLVAGRYLVANLAAPEFTTTGDCESAHSPLQSIAPSNFTLTIGGLRFTVVNDDPASIQNQTLRGCDGQILLEGIRSTG